MYLNIRTSQTYLGHFNNPRYLNEATLSWNNLCFASNATPYWRSSPILATMYRYGQSKRLMIVFSISFLTAILLTSLKGCGNYTPTSLLRGLESDNEKGPLDRIYLALGDEIVSGTPVHSLYIVGCFDESRNASAKTTYRNPNGEVESKPLDRRVYLYEFEPYNLKNGDTIPEVSGSHCQVILGSQNTRAFEYIPQAPANISERVYFSAVTVAGFFLALNSFAASDSSDPVTTKRITQWAKKGFIAWTGLGLAIAWPAYHVAKFLLEKRSNRSVELSKDFTKKLEFMTKSTLATLMDGRDKQSRQFQQFVESDVRKERLLASSIFAKKLVLNFNNNSEVWKNKSVSNHFPEQQNSEYFDAIQRLSEANWKKENLAFQVDYEDGTFDSESCLFVRVKHHRLIELNKGANIFADPKLVNIVGRLKVGTKLIYLERIQRQNFSQPPVRKVELIPANKTEDKGIPFYIHEDFIEVDELKCHT